MPTSEAKLSGYSTLQYGVYDTGAIIRRRASASVSAERFRVPLKTTLKRENEIGASDTRKADEGGLSPG